MTVHEVEIVVPEGADHDRAGETVSVDVDEDEFVLAAARSQGLWLPADCQQGWCTTCAARLLEGTVDQSASRRYYGGPEVTVDGGSPDAESSDGGVDAAAGLILPCTAKPRSDLRVECCRYETMLDHRAEHDLPPGKSKR